MDNQDGGQAVADCLIQEHAEQGGIDAVITGPALSFAQQDRA